MASRDDTIINSDIDSNVDSNIDSDVNSVSENDTVIENPRLEPHPEQRYFGGIIVPRWWRNRLVLLLSGLVVISIGFSVILLINAQSRIEDKKANVSAPSTPELKKAWYLQQETPETVVDLRGGKTLFPDPFEEASGFTNRAYEEQLPEDIFDQSPVSVSTNVIATGISNISKITQVSPTGTVRVVIPEEVVPLEVYEDFNTPETEIVESTPEPEPVVEIASLDPKQDVTTYRTEKWQQFALPFVIPKNAPMIAIVLDDMGVDQRRSRLATALPGPLTLSYMTYASDIGGQSTNARNAGHELMLHVPMQPGNPSIDPGPNVLTTTIDNDEILRRLRWGLDRFDGFVGVNNHMGSKFTQYKDGMRVVLNEIRDRGLIFLDSRTSGRSVASEIAQETGVTFASRNVFLDHIDDPDTVRKQLAQTERLALRHGSAIAIGHPRDATIEVLKEWLPTLAAKGIVLAPLSAIVIRTHQAPANQTNN